MFYLLPVDFLLAEIPLAEQIVPAATAFLFTYKANVLHVTYIFPSIEEKKSWIPQARDHQAANLSFSAIVYETSMKQTYYKRSRIEEDTT